MAQSGGHTRRNTGKSSLPSGVRVLTIGKVARPIVVEADNDNAAPLEIRLARARRWVRRAIPGLRPWLLLGAGVSILWAALG